MSLLLLFATPAAPSGAPNVHIPTALALRDYKTSLTFGVLNG